MRGFLNQWKSLAKEALSQSFLLTKSLRLLTATNNRSLVLVYGPSMLPTLNPGDILLVDHVSPLMGKVGPGDIVSVRSPENPKKTIAKRILAMEGDSVSFLVDPAHSDRSLSVVVPKGHVWIQGDNIYASRDSRKFGPIPYGLIRGKVDWRVWPPNGFGSLGAAN